jgi:hypothetical protein
MADYSLNKGRKIDEDYKRKAKEPLLPESFWTGRRKQLMDASKAGVPPEESIISKVINHKGVKYDNKKPSVNSEVKPSVKVDSKPSVKMSTPPSISKGMPLSDEIDSLVGSSKGSDTAPDAVIKKTEIVKTAPVVSRKSSPSTMKSKASMSGRGGIDMAALEEFKNSYDKEQRPQLDALREYTDNIKLRDAADTENARTKTETVEASGYKKGGMTKRPPKPAKKVPARKFASGGNVSRTSASKRGDGCATKGHTKGKYL